MKTPKTCSIILLALAIVLASGCASVSIPPAQSYDVWMGGGSSQIIHAKSVRIQGAWVSMDVDHSPIGPPDSQNPSTTVLAPMGSVVFIVPNPPK